MDYSTIQATEQSLSQFERDAQQIHHKYRAQLALLTEAHRRGRVIEWLSYDDALWAEVASKHFGAGGCEPDQYSEALEQEIWGNYYDSLTEHEIHAIEREIRKDDPDFYFDDSRNLQIRDLWVDEIRALQIPHTETGWDAFHAVKFKHSPSMFTCDVCGEWTHSHDQRGELIAMVLTAQLDSGNTMMFLVCEHCAQDPDGTVAAFNQAVRERNADDIKHEAERWQGIRNLLAGNGIDPDTGEPTNNQAAGATTGSQSPFLSFDDLMQLPPKTWLIQNILGERDIVMVFGEPGSGKTMILIDLILAACLGKRWADQFDIASPLTVAYAAGEGVSGLKDRFSVALDHWGATTIPGFYFLPFAPQLYSSTRTDSIQNQIDAFRLNHGSSLDLLIVDTLHAATAGADENSAKDMGIVLDAVRAASRELGCAVILCHHTAKDGERERGSSSLHGAMDCMIKVKRNGANQIECFKLKDGQQWKPLTFSLISKGTSAYVYWDGATTGSGQAPSNEDIILRLLQNNPGQRFTSSDVNARTGISRGSAHYAMGRLTGRGLIQHEATPRGSGVLNKWYFDLTT